MKTKLKDEYMEELLESKYASANYRILLLLWQGKPMTTTQIARKLGNIHTVPKITNYTVIKAGHIEVDRIEGRNKFYKACPNRPKQDDEETEVQMTFTEE